METRTKKEKLKKPSISGVESDLSDRQSLRTSFCLSTKASEALVWLAKHYGVKFKDVFDTVCEQLRYDAEVGSTDQQKTILQLLLDTAGKQDLEKTHRYKTPRKTHVLSKGSWKILNQISIKYNIPRDLLISLALIFLHVAAEEDIRELPKKYMKAKEIISNFLSEAYHTEQRLSEILSANDPIRNRFGLPIMFFENLNLAIEANLKNGTPIDPEDYSQSG